MKVLAFPQIIQNQIIIALKRGVGYVEGTYLSPTYLPSTYLPLPTTPYPFPRTSPTPPPTYTLPTYPLPQSEWYASYWNAFLFYFKILCVKELMLWPWRFIYTEQKRVLIFVVALCEN